MMKDIDIRMALLREMNSLHSGEADTLIVQELGICQGFARVDVAVVNGSFHGYEIKSERDTLTRLPSQAEIYNQALEFVTIVAASQHLTPIEILVPPWWGIWGAFVADGEVCFKRLREAHRNPALIPLALSQFLWRDEALAILSEHSLAGGMTSKSRHHLWLRLATSFTTEELGRLVRDRLKLRGEDWRGLASAV